MKKKIIITGGLGYVGTELCKIYSGVSWNHEIVVIDNRFIEEVETSAERKDTKLLDTITKEDGDVVGISKTSKFGQKDAMYISVIQQLITRLETAEEKIAALENN